MVNQSAWDLKGHEMITLTFYANDSLGHVGSQSVQIWKDLVKPEIVIDIPTSNQLCGILAPTFNLFIDEPNLHKKWYTLNGGDNIMVTAQVQVAQSEWDKIGNGTVLIRFYANDTAGNMDYSQVIVRKDAFEPEITIINPLVRQKFGSNPPQFNISVIEETSITCWYQVAGDITQYEFIGTTGTIDEEVWNGLPEGQVMITFYAKDEANNIGSAMINIVKELPEEFSIRGYDVFWIITIIGLTVLVLDSRKKGSW